VVVGPRLWSLRDPLGARRYGQGAARARGNVRRGSFRAAEAEPVTFDRRPRPASVGAHPAAVRRLADVSDPRIDRNGLVLRNQDLEERTIKKLSASRTALSVSISNKTSPFLTGSPSRLRT